MKRGRSTSKPTREEAARFDAIKEAGCVVAHWLGIGWVPCEIHHLTVGGKHGQRRLGHLQSVGLNPWSHRGVPFNGWTADECYGIFGPSYALEPRAFREQYPDDLLLEHQEGMIT